MTRIERKFGDLAAANRKAFVAFVMAGDPDFDTSLAVVRGLPGAGVDVIEMGMPFANSDPGPYQLAQTPKLVPSNWRTTRSADCLTKCFASPSPGAAM